MTEQLKLKVARVIVLREAVRRLTSSMTECRRSKRHEKASRLGEQLDNALMPLYDYRYTDALDIALEDVLLFPRVMDEKQWYAFTVYGDILATRLLLGVPTAIQQQMLHLYTGLEELRCANHHIFSMPTRWNEISRVQQFCKPKKAPTQAAFERLRLKYASGAAISNQDHTGTDANSIDNLVTADTQTRLLGLVAKDSENSVWPAELTTINWGTILRVAKMLAKRLAHAN